MARSIQVAVNHQAAEHVRAERLYYLRCSRFAKADRIAGVLLVLVGVAGVAAVGFRWWTVIWLALGPLEFFSLLTITPLVTMYRFKRNPKFTEIIYIEFSEEGIAFRNSLIDSKLKWEIYEGLLEDDALFLMHYGGLYSVIPKRCFKDVEAMGAFRSLVNSKVQGMASKR